MVRVDFPGILPKVGSAPAKIGVCANALACLSDKTDGLIDPAWLCGNRQFSCS